MYISIYTYSHEEEEQSFSPPPDIAIPIPLGKDNTHLLHQPSDIHVHLPRAFGSRDMDTLTHKRAFIVLRMILIHVLYIKKTSCMKMEATLYCVHIVSILCSDELKK